MHRCRITIMTAAFYCFAHSLAHADTVEGLVVYADGKPAPGAVVYALNARKPLRVNNNRIMLGEQLPRAIADKTGRFSLDVDPADTTGFFAQDMEDATGYCRKATNDDTVSVTIDTPARAEIAVFNGQSGAAGESVVAVQETGFNGVMLQYDGKTDASGILRLKVLAPGRYQVSTWHDVPQVGCCFRSVATRMTKVEIAAGQKESIRLGGTNLPHVGGKIADADGAPLHGVWVQLLPKQKPAEIDGASIAWSTVTERDGSYTVYDVPPGQYDLRLFRRLALNDATRTFEAIHAIDVSENAAGPNAYDFKVDLAPFLPLEPGQDAPGISGKTLDGKPFVLGDLKGSIVVLHFYASWCTPCVQTIGDFEKLAAEFDHSKVAVVGISLDQSSEDALAFVKEKDIRHPVLYQGTWADNPVRTAYRVNSIPTTIVVGPDGKILNIDLFGGALRKYIADKLARAN